MARLAAFSLALMALSRKMVNEKGTNITVSLIDRQGAAMVLVDYT